MHLFTGQTYQSHPMVKATSFSRDILGSAHIFPTPDHDNSVAVGEFRNHALCHPSSDNPAWRSDFVKTFPGFSQIFQPDNGGR